MSAEDSSPPLPENPAPENLAPPGVASESTAPVPPPSKNCVQPVEPAPPPSPPVDAPPAPGDPAVANAPEAPPLLAEAVAAAPPAPPEAEPAAHPVIFHGRTDEYFRIWIVNTLLTLLTLGVFFSWAKVRKRRYLRGSTELLGHRFDYRADPRRLLIGHAIVLTLFLGYSLFGVVYPWIRFGVLGLCVVLLPWIIVRSFTFNAHHTAYRGLRFRFNRSLSAAAQVYLFQPILVVLSLGICYPGWQRAKRDYAVSNHRFGDAYFRFAAPVGRFYTTYLFAGLIVFAAAFTGAVIMGLLLFRQPGTQPTLVQMLPFFIVYGFGFYIGRQLIYARLFNHAWNHTRLDEHRFRARLDTGRWLGLQLANLGAIIGTAGLFYPWAVIRAQRYAASCLEFVPAGSVENIQRLGGSDGSATGDMAAEFIGVDFGL